MKMFPEREREQIDLAKAARKLLERKGVALDALCAGVRFNVPPIQAHQIVSYELAYHNYSYTGLLDIEILQLEGFFHKFSSNADLWLLTPILTQPDGPERALYFCSVFGDRQHFLRQWIDGSPFSLFPLGRSVLGDELMIEFVLYLDSLRILSFRVPEAAELRECYETKLKRNDLVRRLRNEVQKHGKGRRKKKSNSRSRGRNRT